jgi:hypothetical protein
LDVPHMNLDLLDETYPMVKSKLYFMVFDHTGLIGGTHRSDRSDKACQFWVRTITHAPKLRPRPTSLKLHRRPPSQPPPLLPLGHGSSSNSPSQPPHLSCCPLMVDKEVEAVRPPHALPCCAPPLPASLAGGSCHLSLAPRRR